MTRGQDSLMNKLLSVEDSWEAWEKVLKEDPECTPEELAAVKQDYEACQAAK